MDKHINLFNQRRLEEIRAELFTMANSYAGDEYGHIAIRLHHICNKILETNKKMKTTAKLN